MLKDSEKAALIRIQTNINSAIEQFTRAIAQQTQIKIPTRIQLSSIDFTEMQKTSETSQLKNAVKLTRADVMETTKR